MPPVFSHTPLAADVWDMQGALIYFGSNQVGAIQGQQQMPTGFGSASTTGATSGVAPIIALGIQLGIQRGVGKRYPINVRRVIYTLGNPEGSLSLNVLFGPQHSMATFINTFSAVGNNAATTGHGNGTTAIVIRPFGSVIGSQGQNATTVAAGNLGLGTWEISDPVITSIGLTITESQGANIPVTSQVAMTFTSLTIH